MVFHTDGVISQFEGYEDLAELDWDDYRNWYGDILVSIASSRPKATQRTSTRRPSRPTCSCSSTC